MDKGLGERVDRVASRRSGVVQWIDVDEPAAGGTAATAFAAAARTAVNPLLVLQRPGRALNHGDVAFDEKLAAIFAASPGLACVAFAGGASSPPDGPVPLAPVDISDPCVREAPVAVVVRTSALVHGLGSLIHPAGDPWLEVVERFQAARAGVEWRHCPAPPEFPAPPVGPKPVTLRDLSLESPGVAADPRSDEVDAHPFGPAWAELVRVVQPDGHRYVATVPGLVLAAGEFVEASLAVVRVEPFASGMPLYVRGATPETYPAEPDPTARTVAWLHAFGLPGGVELMLFHNPDLNRDMVGRTHDAPRGWHPSRRLGWAMAEPSLIPPKHEWPRANRAPLVREAGGGYRVGDPGEGDREVGEVLLRDQGGGRAVFAARTRSGPVLTIDPSALDREDIRLLGYLPTGEMPVGLVAERASGAAAEPLPRARGRQRAKTLVRRSSTIARRPLAGRSLRGSAQPRILLVVPWLSVGGGDHFLLAMVSALRQRGFAFWAALTYSRDESPIDNRAAFTPHLEGVVCLPEDQSGVPVETALARFVHANDIDQIMICGGWQLYPGLARFRAACPHVRVVDQLFNDVGHIANNRAQAPSIDLTIAAYRGLERTLVDRFGEDPDRVALAYIGIDVERFRPVSPDDRRAGKTALGLDPDRPVWGYVGRLSDEKRIGNLLEALDRIRGLHDAQVVVQGDGPTRAQVEALAAEKPGLMRFSGFAPDVRPVLQSLDVYILPSAIEGIPLAVMEAMACGAIPVATAVGGVPELVDSGRTGYLVEPDDIGALAMGLLAAARTGPVLREQMAREGRAAVADRMSHEAMVERYAELLGRP